MEPIELMMSEHRLIEKVLDSLESYGEAVGRGDDVDPKRLPDYVAFLRGYADAIHHGKEEDILFAALRQQGCPEDFSPVVAGICRDHETGRMLVDDLASAARKTPWSDDVRRRVRHLAADFVSLLRRHIREEDDYVFPRAVECLSEDMRGLVARACERFEADHRSRRDELQRLAERLTGTPETA